MNIPSKSIFKHYATDPLDENEMKKVNSAVEWIERDIKDCVHYNNFTCSIYKDISLMDNKLSLREIYEVQDILKKKKVYTGSYSAFKNPGLQYKGNTIYSTYNEDTNILRVGWCKFGKDKLQKKMSAFA